LKINTGYIDEDLDTDLMIPKVLEISTSTLYVSPKPGVSTTMISSFSFDVLSYDILRGLIYRVIERIAELEIKSLSGAGIGLA